MPKPTLGMQPSIHFEYNRGTILMPQSNETQELTTQSRAALPPFIFSLDCKISWRNIPQQGYEISDIDGTGPVLGQFYVHIWNC